MEQYAILNPMIARPQNHYDRYHAHVYFGADTVEQASLLCQQAGQAFGVAVGRVHQKQVGPHPHWSCQIAFDSNDFDNLISWLETHRNGLDILIHGLTGDDYADHTTHASWLGNPTPLKLEMFQKQA